ncbi:MAG: TIR domain-containing protein [Ruminococcaceae bacterium]|nr:TIR domain-containing protein [Oscillospiraceae bacterium]
MEDKFDSGVGNEEKYYFISYNVDENDKRVDAYVEEFKSRGLNVWYDVDALPVGQRWDAQIAQGIKNCEAVIMFVTKALFVKKEPYVVTEFDLATQFYKKKVYIVQLDKIENSDVPDELANWWVIIGKLQTVYSFKYKDDVSACVDKIMKTIDFAAGDRSVLLTPEQEYKLYLERMQNYRLNIAHRKGKNPEIASNIYIEGEETAGLYFLDTLDVKANLVFLDPPQNFGEPFEGKTLKGEKQKNRLKSFLYTNVKLAKEILTENGVVVLIVDEHYLSFAKEICESIMNENNLVAMLGLSHREKVVSSVVGGNNEYILVYAKEKNNFTRLQEYIEEGSTKVPVSLMRMGDKESRPTLCYPIYVSEDLKFLSLKSFDGAVEVYPTSKDGEKRSWRLSAELVEKDIASGDIVAKKTEDGKFLIFKLQKSYRKVRSVWGDDSFEYRFTSVEIQQLMKEKLYFGRPAALMRELFDVFLDPNGIAVDVNSVAGSSARAVMELNDTDGGNRRFVLLQHPEKLDERSDAGKKYGTVCDFAEEYIKRVGSFMKEQEKTAFMVMECKQVN